MNNPTPGELPDEECCQNNPNPGVTFCKPDPGRETYQPSVAGDDNEYGGCERWRLIVGLDEQGMSCEMGLYFDFNVTDDGIPYGCEGFTPEWLNQGITMNNLFSLIVVFLRTTNL